MPVVQPTRRCNADAGHKLSRLVRAACASVASFHHRHACPARLSGHPAYVLERIAPEQFKEHTERYLERHGIAVNRDLSPLEAELAAIAKAKEIGLHCLALSGVCAVAYGLPRPATRSWFAEHGTDVALSEAEQSFLEQPDPRQREIRSQSEAISELAWVMDVIPHVDHFAGGAARARSTWYQRSARARAGFSPTFGSAASKRRWSEADPSIAPTGPSEMPACRAAQRRRACRTISRGIASGPSIGFLTRHRAGTTPARTRGA